MIDPFESCPELVRQSKDFVIKYCVGICEKYPWWDFPHVLGEATYLACNAVRLFKPELGNWERFLEYHLRHLHSIAEQKDEDYEITGTTRAQWERRIVRLGSDLYEWDDLDRIVNLQPWDKASKRKRRRMRKPIFPDGDGTAVVQAGDWGFIAFRLGSRLSYAELCKLLRTHGLTPNGESVDRYDVNEPRIPRPSLRVRRICKGWAIDPRRMRFMDQTLEEAAVEIEDGLAEDEVPIFNWMMSEDKRSQSDLAREHGITTGNLSKIKGRIADKFVDWCNRNGKI